MLDHINLNMMHVNKLLIDDIIAFLHSLRHSWGLLLVIITIWRIVYTRSFISFTTIKVRTTRQDKFAKSTCKLGLIWLKVTQDSHYGGTLSMKKSFQIHLSLKPRHFKSHIPPVPMNILVWVSATKYSPKPFRLDMLPFSDIFFLHVMISSVRSWLE